MMTVTAWRLRRLLAALGASLIVISYVTCIIMAKTRDTYIGGIAWPYFSDTGRDKPAYYVFSVLNCTASTLMFGFMGLQYLYVKAWFGLCPDAAPHAVRAVVALVCGLLAPVGSILLSVFTTNKYPDIHLYSAYAFFLLILTYCVVTLTLMRSLAKEHAAQAKMMPARYAVTALLAVGVLLYIPVGLAVACSFEHLTLQKCLIIEPHDYCFDNLLNDNETTFYDYTNCSEANTLRSSTQFVSIIAVMLFIALHSLDPHPQGASDLTQGVLHGRI